VTNKLIKIGIGLSLIINLLALAVIIWASTGGIFRLINSSLIQPIYARDVSQFKLLDVGPTDTVFLGDSITEGGEWGELFPQSIVRNRGIVGDTTTGVIERLDQITKGQPAQIFLMIGINDIAANVPQSDIVANITKIVDKIREDSPDTKVYLQSLLPHMARFQKKIESLNSELEKAVASKAIWVNLYPEFLNKKRDSMDKSLSNDNAHLLGQGYILWKSAITEYVNKDT